MFFCACVCSRDVVKRESMFMFYSSSDCVICTLGTNWDPIVIESGLKETLDCAAIDGHFILCLLPDKIVLDIMGGVSCL